MAGKSINIITLGCSKNRVDSEKLLRQLEVAGHTVEYDRFDYESDIVVINTCGFINDAKEESVETILDFVNARREGRIEALHVMGCLSERYMDDLRKEIPEVDSYFGVNDIASVVRGLGSRFNSEYELGRILTGPPHYAYLKISEGCDRTCAFCAIPAIRGRYSSRPIDELFAEAEELAAGGVRELILIAQDLSYYGLDLYGSQMLSPLVEKLLEIKSLKWIRLHYLYPANFPMEIIELMKKEPRLCRYIDLPVQHISERVLSKMRRSHRGDETRRLLETIRKELPDAVIRTTLIAGHPGESAKEFNELAAFVKDFRFDRLGVFPYSHEENTYGALKYRDTISAKEKGRRVELLMEMQEIIASELNEARLGSIMEVVVDRQEGVFLACRGYGDSPDVDQEIMVPAKDGIVPGEFINVRITRSEGFDLYGEIHY